MKNLDNGSVVVQGDAVTILRREEVRPGYVVEVDNDTDYCQVAVGDMTSEGHQTIAWSISVPCSWMNRLGDGRWVVLVQ